MSTEKQGLQRFISRSGYCSRRKAAQLIDEGRVRVNNEVCTVPWQEVSDQDKVSVDGAVIKSGLSGRKLYLALHKPPGYLCTNSDPEGRPCAIDLLKPVFKERLFHVGRLDKNSSGLIFFTNDGDFAQQVQHPSNVIEKEYQVKTRTQIPEFMLEHWRRGIVVEGVKYRLKNYRLLGSREVSLILTEGLNREIRRVFEHFNIAVKRVHRLRIGQVRLKGIAMGTFRPLSGYEIKSLLAGEREGKSWVQHPKEEHPAYVNKGPAYGAAHTRRRKVGQDSQHTRADGMQQGFSREYSRGSSRGKFSRLDRDSEGQRGRGGERPNGFARKQGPRSGSNQGQRGGNSRGGAPSSRSPFGRSLGPKTGRN